MARKKVTLFDRYKIKLVAERPILGTTPPDPNVYENWIAKKQQENIEKYRKAYKNVSNSKYHDAKDIDPEKIKQQLEGIFNHLEATIGRSLTDDEKKELLEGKGEDLIISVMKDKSKVPATIFPKDENGKAYIFPNWVQGYLKSSGEALARVGYKIEGKEKKDENFFASISNTARQINQTCGVQESRIIPSHDIVREPDGSPELLHRILKTDMMGKTITRPVASEMLPEGTKIEFTLKILSGPKIQMSKEVLEVLFEYGELRGFGQWRNADYGRFRVESIKKI